MICIDASSLMFSGIKVNKLRNFIAAMSYGILQCMHSILCRC